MSANRWSEYLLAHPAAHADVASPAISSTFVSGVVRRSSNGKCDDRSVAASSRWSDTKLDSNKGQEGARTVVWAQHRVRQQRASLDHWKREESFDGRTHPGHYRILGREEQRCECRLLPVFVAVDLLEITTWLTQLLRFFDTLVSQLRIARRVI